MSEQRKEQIMNYQVTYELDGKEITSGFDATSAGSAFGKCVRKFPKCKLIQAGVYRKWADGELWMTYDPPSRATVEPLPKENFTQTEMPLDIQFRA